MAGVYRCPYCRAEYDAKFVVCVRCGMNLKTGRHHDVVVGSTDDEDDAEPGPPQSRIAAAWIAEYLPGFFRPVLLITSLLLAAFGLFVVIMGVVAIALMPIGALSIAAVGGIAYAQATAWLLIGEFQKLTDCLVDFDGTRWTLWFILLMIPGVAFILIASHIAGT